MNNSERNLIFICYSRKDNTPPLTDFHKIFADQLRGVKLPLKSFSDADIDTGTRWRDAIKTALGQTRIALLLEGEGLYTTPFVLNEEIPKFLAAEQPEITIFRVPIRHVSPYLIPDSLQELQTVHPRERPLSDLGRAQRDLAISKIIDKIVSTYQQNHSSQGRDKKDEFLNPPFEIVETGSGRSVQLFTERIFEWIQTPEFATLQVPLEAGFYNQLQSFASVKEILHPEWKLSMPVTLPYYLRGTVDASLLEASAKLEQRVALSYPRFRDAQLALYMCLNNKTGSLEKENLRHARGIIKSLFRKHGLLWMHTSSFWNALKSSPDFDSLPADFFEFNAACRSIPYCELGILQRLQHASESDENEISLEMCYKLLDRMCHWLHMTNRLMNTIEGVPPYRRIEGA